MFSIHFIKSQSSQYIGPHISFSMPWLRFKFLYKEEMHAYIVRAVNSPSRKRTVCKHTHVWLVITYSNQISYLSKYTYFVRIFKGIKNDLRISKFLHRSSFIIQTIILIFSAFLLCVISNSVQLFKA